MDRRDSGLLFPFGLACVLVISGMIWRHGVCQASHIQFAIASQVIKTTLLPTQSVASPKLPSPSTTSSAKTTNDGWKTHVVQTWKWAYQIQIPKGWHVVDYANENGADSGVNYGGPQLGFASFSPANSGEPFPEITVAVAVDDGGKQYQDASGAATTVGGSPAKMTTAQEGVPKRVYVLHGNESYEFVLHSASADETFDHVLKTLVFLPLAPSLVYTDTQYGFSLSMPLEWRGFTKETKELRMDPIADSNEFQEAIDHSPESEIDSGQAI